MRDAFLAAQRPVVFTRHVNTPEDAGMMSTRWRDLIASQDACSHIVKTLKTSNCILLEKSQYDTFWGTSLDSILRGLGVGQSDVWPLLKESGKHIVIVGAGDAAFDYALNLTKKQEFCHYSQARQGCKISGVALGTRTGKSGDRVPGGLSCQRGGGRGSG